MEGAVCLLYELLATSSQNNSARFSSRAASQKVVALTSDLLLLKKLTASDGISGKVVGGGLDRGAGCTSYTQHVLLCNTASTEASPVSKPLGAEVTNRELGKNHVCSSFDAALKLVVDNLPLCVNNTLVQGRVFDADLSVLLLALQLQLNVEQKHFRVHNALGLLFKSCVGKCLLESNTVYEHRFCDGATGDLFDANHLHVPVVLVKLVNSSNTHRCEKVLVAAHELGVKRGTSNALQKETLTICTFVFAASHLQLLDTGDGHHSCLADTGHYSLGVNAVLEEDLTLLENLTSNKSY
mmetsp:Transcript_1348/g.2651  ORF Transcript_1348/g.2651 Transcript_1348/m.2651 type:complete len:297 (-) Transcript_1348:464-1354(-)